MLTYLYFNTRSKTVIKITSFVFRTVIYSLIHFLDEKFHMCNGVKSCLNMWIILQDVEYIILTANLYRLIFVLIRLQLRSIFTTLCFTLSLFSLCAWSVDWKVCFYEKKHMACYNFGPNAKKNWWNNPSIWGSTKIGVKPFMKSHFHHFSISKDIFQLWIVWQLGEICSGLTLSQVQNIVMF